MEREIIINIFIENLLFIWRIEIHKKKLKDGDALDVHRLAIAQGLFWSSGSHELLQ